MDAHLDKLEKLTVEYVRENSSLIILAFLITCAAFGYELFNFSLSIDEELKSFDSGGLDWIRAQRWGTFLLLKLFMPESLIPFYPTLVSLVFLITSGFLLFLIIEGDKISKIIFLLLFLTFPSTAYYMEFNTFNFAVSAGLASVLSGVFFLKRFIETNSYRYVFLSVIFTTFSMSIYQSMLSAWICVFFLYLLHKTLNGKITGKIARDFVVAVSVISFSLISYKVIAFLFMKFYKLTESNYLERFVGWTRNGYSQTIDTIVLYLVNHFTGNAFYGEKTFLSIWLIVPFIILIIFRKRKISLKITGILFLIAVILSPFCIAIGLGFPLPVRSLVGLPLMIGGLAYMASLNAKKNLKYFFLILSVFIALHNSFSTTRLFYADYLSGQADRDFANRILDRMYETDLPYDTRRPVPVVIIGEKGHTANTAFIRSETFGSSFFEWEGGNPWRILSFIKLLGVQDFEVANMEQYSAALKESEKMKKWPHKSSILYTGEIIIIKLGDVTAAQVKQVW